MRWLRFRFYRKEHTNAHRYALCCFPPYLDLAANMIRFLEHFLAEWGLYHPVYISPYFTPLQSKQLFQFAHFLTNLQFQLSQLGHDLAGGRVLHGLILGFLVFIDGQVIAIFYDLRLGHEKGFFRALAVFSKSRLRNRAMISGISLSATGLRLSSSEKPSAVIS